MFTKIKKHINIVFIIIFSQLSHIKNSDKEYAIEYNIICINGYSRDLFRLKNDQPFPKVYINDTEKTSEIMNKTNIYSYKCSSEGNIIIRLVWDTKLTNMESMFGFVFGQDYITFIDFTNFDSSEVISMECLFCNGNGIKHISFNNFNTSKVTNLHTYFCDSDENLTIRLVWDTTLTNMKSMFAFNQNYITFIDFTNFDSSEVTNMEYLFSGETGIKHISFNNFNTSKVTSFRKMF